MVFTKLLKNWKERRNARVSAQAAASERARAREEAADNTHSAAPFDVTRAVSTTLPTTRVSAAHAAGLAQSLARFSRPKGKDHPLASASEDLTAELAAVVLILKEEYKTRLDNPFRALAVLTGMFESQGGPYLYLRIPGRPGFLMTPTEDRIALSRAAEALPLLQNAETGTAERPALFARRSGTVATLIPLEPGLWHFTLQSDGAEETHTVATSRLAERIVALAVDEMSGS